ncbi:MAG: hypothetical protein IT276_06825 [Ignavibacteriaceae bacterium]|jgi:hypothetical protein|nr:hypothetical protein [Ignavibacteriaceae bacterium]HMN23741.1 hypothetical protein [Ignavibacteriaceae bacterium]HRP94350.1 hypothetical protein [Ignavibacteriaceae bacterium]HRQ55661.1 hypothetical protein [Ignavibacteriaceae bacterium]
MMEITKDMITALVDGEITDANVKQELFSKIESDKEFAIDFKMQTLVKNLIKEKVVFQKTPDKVKAKILKSIGSTTKVESVNKSFFSGLFEKPAFSFATAFVVVLAIVLIIINRPVDIENKDFAIEQLGSDNMFVQAQNNFNSILQGKLAPQLASNSADEIKNFFNDSGVKYSTSVPNVLDWNLLGAVVSEDKGEKFAHHVYVDKEGKLAYLFQVDESYLNSHEIISLSDDLIKYLDEGNCYTSVTDSSVTLFTKIENNICAVVSNANPKQVQELFCSI